MNSKLRRITTTAIAVVAAMAIIPGLLTTPAHAQNGPVTGEGYAYTTHYGENRVLTAPLRPNAWCLNTASGGKNTIYVKFQNPFPSPTIATYRADGINSEETLLYMPPKATRTVAITITDERALYALENGRPITAEVVTFGSTVIASKKQWRSVGQNPHKLRRMAMADSPRILPKTQGGFAMAVQIDGVISEMVTCNNGFIYSAAVTWGRTTI